MALWDKVKHELDRAGRVAQDALDEGKLRLEAMRVRQLADRGAQHLGYAVFRARRAGRVLPDEELDRYAATLEEHEAEAARLEQRLAAMRAEAASPPSAASETSSASPPGGTDDRGANI